MSPTADERLTRIRYVLHRGMRYYATAYLKTSPQEEHVIAERDLLQSHMLDYATVMALLEGDELDDRSMMETRHHVVSRYIESVRTDPWIPPEPGPSPSDLE